MVNINVPYLSQLHNNLNPYGSCNVTSAAMILNWAGFKHTPDQLYQYMLNHNLSRHSPYDLAVVAERMGIEDTFDPYASCDKIINHLSQGNPVIVHGYFTGFGHIIVLKGIQGNSFIAHDPYGEWTSSGYIQNGSTTFYGKNILYSFNLINRLCNENGIWTHFCKKNLPSPPPARPAISPVFEGVSLQDVFYDDLKVPQSKIFNLEVHINFQIQVNLGKRYDGKRDAIFGPKTKSALESYCTSCGLPSDPITKPLAKALIEGKAKI